MCLTGPVPSTIQVTSQCPNQKFGHDEHSETHLEKCSVIDPPPVWSVVLVRRGERRSRATPASRSQSSRPPQQNSRFVVDYQDVTHSSNLTSRNIRVCRRQCGGEVSDRFADFHGSCPGGVVSFFDVGSSARKIPSYGVGLSDIGEAVLISILDRVPPRVADARPRPEPQRVKKVGAVRHRSRSQRDSGAETGPRSETHVAEPRCDRGPGLLHIVKDLFGGPIHC